MRGRDASTYKTLFLGPWELADQPAFSAGLTAGTRGESTMETRTDAQRNSSPPTCPRAWNSHHKKKLIIPFPLLAKQQYLQRVTPSLNISYFPIAASVSALQTHHHSHTPPALFALISSRPSRVLLRCSPPTRTFPLGDLRVNLPLGLLILLITHCL